MQSQTAMLEQQRYWAEQDVLKFQRQLREAVDPDVDEADPGLTMQTVTFALLENACRKIDSIKQAITCAQKGTYGVCEACGELINPERLEIFPQTTLCVTCKAKTEKPKILRPI